MEFKGTKGEWLLCEDFRQPKILNESNQVIFTHSKECYDTTEKSHIYYSHNKMIANAKLIASAPDLLKALQTVIVAIESMDFQDGTLFKASHHKAVKAINKALL